MKKGLIRITRKKLLRKIFPRVKGWKKNADPRSPPLKQRGSNINPGARKYERLNPARGWKVGCSSRKKKNTKKRKNKWKIREEGGGKPNSWSRQETIQPRKKKVHLTSPAEKKMLDQKKWKWKKRGDQKRKERIGVFFQKNDRKRINTRT